MINKEIINIMAKRDYTNGEIIIHWDSELCVGAKTCWKELSSVFKPKERPWVKPYGATTEEIINVIDKCPNKALTWEKVKE